MERRAVPDAQVPHDAGRCRGGDRSGVVAALARARADAFRRVPPAHEPRRAAAVHQCAARRDVAGRPAARAAGVRRALQASRSPATCRSICVKAGHHRLGAGQRLARRHRPARSGSSTTSTTSRTGRCGSICASSRLPSRTSFAAATPGSQRMPEFEIPREPNLQDDDIRSATGDPGMPAQAAPPRRDALFGALILVSALLGCTIAYLALTVPGPWFPHASPKAWNVKDLALARGVGSVAGDELVVTAPTRTALRW